MRTTSILTAVAFATSIAIPASAAPVGKPISVLATRNIQRRQIYAREPFFEEIFNDAKNSLTSIFGGGSTPKESPSSTTSTSPSSTTSATSATSSATSTTTTTTTSATTTSTQSASGADSPSAPAPTSTSDTSPDDTDDDDDSGKDGAKDGSATGDDDDDDDNSADKTGESKKTADAAKDAGDADDGDKDTSGDDEDAPTPVNKLAANPTPSSKKSTSSTISSSKATAGAGDNGAEDDSDEDKSAADTDDGSPDDSEDERAPAANKLLSIADDAQDDVLSPKTAKKDEKASPPVLNPVDQTEDNTVLDEDDADTDNDDLSAGNKKGRLGAGSKDSASLARTGGATNSGFDEDADNEDELNVSIPAGRSGRAGTSALDDTEEDGATEPDADAVDDEDIEGHARI